MRYTEVSTYKARRILHEAGLRRLPRVGYEVSLGDGRWIASTGHAKFGWFDSAAKAPFVLKEQG